MNINRMKSTIHSNSKHESKDFSHYTTRIIINNLFLNFFPLHIDLGTIGTLVFLNLVQLDIKSEICSRRTKDIKMKYCGDNVRNNKYTLLLVRFKFIQ